MGNYIDPSDIETWPSGCDAACKAEIIAKAEELIEKILGTHFYEKPFDIELNGNGKNRLFIPLRANIISVTHIYICEIELPTSWYGFDKSSVYLDLCQSAAAGVGYPWAELYYRLGEADELGLFPRGYNNVRVVGTYGHETTPAPIKNAVEYLIDAINEGTFGTVGVFKSEKIGRYSYTLGATGYAKEGVYTGIPKVDIILRAYMKQRKIKIMAP